MKRYCKGLVVDRELVAAAYDRWRAGEAGHKNEWRVKEQYGSADALIDEITREVASRSLAFEPIERHTHHEPTNGKVRTIGKESVKQQVVDYLIVLSLEPMLRAKIGFWQVAGVPGKGQASCRRILRKWVHEGGYHVKGDVRKCYPSITHDVVMRILRRYVASEDVLYMAEAVLATYEFGGLEIGSYFSLQMAQLVLSFAYHFVEGLGKRRRGKWMPLVRHQLWHMDDFLLCGSRKADVRSAARSLARYMREEFGLELKPWKVSRTDEIEPLDMGGFVVRDTRTTLRPKLFLRARRAFRRFAKKRSLRLARRCCSYWGWFRNSDSEGYVRSNGIRRLFNMARAIVSAAGRRGTPCSAPQAAPA